MSDVTSKLRDEIIECQKARTDLLKWKIILVAALGGGAFGIGATADSARPILLGLIPLVCAYVDVVCIHNDIRIRIIGSFLESQGTDDQIKAYEGYCARNRGAFLVERLALVATTLLFSVMVGAVGLYPKVAAMFFTENTVAPLPEKDILVAAAATGAVVSIGAITFLEYKLRHLRS